MATLSGFEVGEMELAEATELFGRYANTKVTSDARTAEIELIVRELGCFALAVTLVATHVSRVPHMSVCTS